MVFVLPSSSEVTGFNVTVEYTDAEGKRGSVTDSFKAVRNASSPWIPCQFLNLTGIKVKRVTVVPHPVVITVEAQ